MTRWRWWALLDAHAGKLGAAIIAGGVAAALFGVRYEANERRDRDQAAIEVIEESARTSRAETCEGLRNGQRADRLLIDTVLETPVASVPLLDAPTYEQLPPLLQQYLRELATGEGQPPPEDGQTLAERLAAFREEHLGPDDLPAFCIMPPG